MIIRHKPRHGDNKPHTQKTAQTQLETQAGLSPAWVPAQDNRTAQYALVSVCVGVQAHVGYMPTKVGKKKAVMYEHASYGKV